MTGRPPVPRLPSGPSYGMLWPFLLFFSAPTVLVNDFKARYLAVGKRLNPGLYHFLAGDSRFQETVDTPREAVFLIRQK